jgi:hypothetical protein
MILYCYDKKINHKPRGLCHFGMPLFHSGRVTSRLEVADNQDHFTCEKPCPVVAVIIFVAVSSINQDVRYEI